MIMQTRTKAVDLWPDWTDRAAELYGFSPAAPAGDEVCPSVLLGRSCARHGPSRCLCRDPRWWLLGEGWDVVRLWRDSAGALVVTVDPYRSLWVAVPGPDDRWLTAFREWADEHGLAVELREPDARGGGGISLHLRRGPRLVSVPLPSSPPLAEDALRVAVLLAPVTGRRLAA